MPDHVKDLYQRWGATFAERGELPLDEWRALIEEWPQVTAEPGGVDYVEVDTGGVPAMSPWFDFEATGASYDDNDSKDMLLNRELACAWPACSSVTPPVARGRRRHPAPGRLGLPQAGSVREEERCAS